MLNHSFQIAREQQGNRVFVGNNFESLNLEDEVFSNTLCLSIRRAMLTNHPHPTVPFDKVVWICKRYLSWWELKCCGWDGHIHEIKDAYLLTMTHRLSKSTKHLDIGEKRFLNAC